MEEGEGFSHASLSTPLLLFFNHESMFGVSAMKWGCAEQKKKKKKAKQTPNSFNREQNLTAEMV